jgi:hypothetical protein
MEKALSACMSAPGVNGEIRIGMMEKAISSRFVSCVPFVSITRTSAASQMASAVECVAVSARAIDGSIEDDTFKHVNIADGSETKETGPAREIDQTQKTCDEKSGTVPTRRIERIVTVSRIKYVGEK